MASRIYRSPVPDLELVETDLIDFLFSNPREAPPSSKAYVEAHSGSGISRQQIITRTMSIARTLCRLSIQTEDVVAILSPNSIHFPVYCYAALYVGAVVSPISPALTSKDIQHQLKQGGAKVLFVHSSRARAAREAIQGTGVKHIIQIDGESRSPHCDFLITDLQNRDEQGPRTASLRVPRQSADTAFLCFSSGTSGPVKGVILTHGNIVANIQQWERTYHFDTTPSPVTVTFLPFSHIYGLNVFVCSAFWRGQTCVVIEEFTMELFLKTVEHYRPAELYLVPPVAIRLVQDSALSRYDLRCVKRMMSAAAPLSAATATRIEDGFRSAYGQQVYCHQSWGMTETSPLATGVLNSLLATQRQTVGVPVPNMRMRLVDPETLLDITATEPDGQTTLPGEILCRGPNITPGYLNNPAATAELFHVDPYTGLSWLRTGDVACVNLRTGCFVIRDRIKEMIKYKGLQVVPSELEGLLLQHPRVKDCGVTAIHDDVIGTELPLAFVVLDQLAASGDDGVTALAATGDEIQRWLAERVANHKRLRGGIRFVREIPKSPSGKILRRLLKAQAASPPGVLKSSQSMLGGTSRAVGGQRGESKL